jgi:hypothetical protein
VITQFAYSPIEGEEMSDDWDDDDDETRFGEQAKFLWCVGGDIFGNRSSAVYLCNLCKKYFQVFSVEAFDMKMGIYRDIDAPRRHSELSAVRSKALRDLMQPHGACTCSYHEKESAWFGEGSSASFRWPRFDVPGLKLDLDEGDSADDD